MPKVARMVVSGSRPSSGRSVDDLQRRADQGDDQGGEDERSQKLPVAVSTRTPM